MRVEKIVPLKIALVAWNMDIAQLILRDFMTHNLDQVRRYRTQKNCVELTDGTEIYIINDFRDFRGKRFDQIIICDDDRWNIFKKKKDISVMINELKISSCAPEEYQILRYEY